MRAGLDIKNCPPGAGKTLGGPYLPARRQVKTSEKVSNISLNVNEIWPNKTSYSPKITLIDQSSKTEIKQEDTADYIGASLAQNLTDPWTYEGTIADRHIGNIEVNNDEILKICKDIDINKGSSIPNISGKALRAMAWNSLSVTIRKSQTYISLKDLLNKKLISEIVPN